MRHLCSIAAVVFLGLTVAGTSAVAGENEEKRKGPDPRIGEKVDRICFQRNIDGWREAKGHKKAVLLERGLNDWYFVRVSGSCRANDFKFAHTIGIESRPAGGCVRRGDVILVRDAGDFVNRCFIKSIHRWDDDANGPEENEAS